MVGIRVQWIVSISVPLEYPDSTVSFSFQVLGMEGVIMGNQYIPCFHLLFGPGNGYLSRSIHII